MIALPGRAQSRLGLVPREPRDDGFEISGRRRLTGFARPVDRVKTINDRVPVIGDGLALVVQRQPQVIPPRHTPKPSGERTGPA